MTLMKIRRSVLSLVLITLWLLSGNLIAAEVFVSPKLLDAAESGDVESQYLLGLELCCNEKNTKRAVAWLCRATRQNHLDAPYQLGNIYTGKSEEKGKIVNTFASGHSDLSFAYMWYTVAMAQGHSAAEKQRANLENRMSQEQIMQGKRWATGWRKLRCPSV